MTKLTINREFLKRHLFAIVVLAGMGGWFGYDGLITYPRMTAAALYESIEKSAPPEGTSDEKLEAFKTQKIQTQYGLAAILLLVALAAGLHLLDVSRLDFAFDRAGFTWRGRRYAFGDIRKVDRSKWAKKGILVLTLVDGTVTLDAWHHTGVNEFEKYL